MKATIHIDLGIDSNYKPYKVPKLALCKVQPWKKETAKVIVIGCTKSGFLVTSLVKRTWGFCTGGNIVMYTQIQTRCFPPCSLINWISPQLSIFE